MAVFSRELRAIYLCNPGTGSSSIEQTLLGDLGWERIGEKHDSLTELRQCAVTDLDRYFVFTSIRNPYDWFAAEYSRFGQTWAKLMEDDPHHWIHKDNSVVERIRIAKSKNFAAFLQYYIDNTWAPQGKWRVQYWGDARFVMTTETLSLDWKNLLRILQLPYTPLRHINKTPIEARYASSDVFTKKQADTVFDIYRPYFELFEYRSQPLASIQPAS